MTDRYAAYIVVLDQDYRDDSGGASIMDAIRMIRGVISVEPVVASYESHVASQRRDNAWRRLIIDTAEKGPDG